MSDKLMVSLAAVFRLVTQRSSPQTKGKECGSKESSRLWGGALRDKPRTAAKVTNRLNILIKYVKFRFHLIAYKTRLPIINLFKRSSACREAG